MAFDTNKDGKISKDELPERMQDLIAKGDMNGDGVLDKDEIKALATKLRQEGIPRGLGAGTPVRGGVNVERALDDLNLSGAKLESATAAVKTNQTEVRKIQDDARTSLLAKIKEVLSEDEFKKLSEATPRRGPGIRGNGANLERALDGLKLSEANKDKVGNLLKASQESVRKERDVARAALLRKMKEILSEDEFKRFQEVTGGPVQAAAAQPAAPDNR
jgi:hypothetical protein